MKAILKAPVAALLASLASAVLKKYRPLVVMVTGSVGKTSTKDAVAAALSSRFNLRASEKSYNSEFGVPLTVFGSKNPWENPAAWIRVLQRALALLLLPSHYPKVLVLEVGADRPGDLTKILKIAKPDMVVVTRLPEVPVHVEAYASPQAVREEEFAPAYALPSGAPLIISADDPHAVTMAARLPAKVFTFGFADGAHVRLEGYSYFEEGETRGMEATVTIDGVPRTLRVPGALGRSQLYAPAAALASCLALDITPEDAFSGLQAYLPPPGRARILPGVRGSILIDDSYNASPAAVEEAISGMSLIPHSGRSIAVLGDMLELGRYSVEEHERIGLLSLSTCDLLVTVGSRARAMQDAGRREGIAEERIQSFENSDKAGDALINLVQEGDVILVKGSQGMRMERIVKRLLANSVDEASLVRQEVEWQRR